ncbi:MAG: hypothetical protein BWY11_01623 [Firmicutes bacterium ADurb.Bin182]|nr:MAG: hypothetical protein BWY11_01623 [Firmicutes bacterium ADurb.Bin182]
MAKFCEYCGRQNEDASAFCIQCGRELRRAEYAQTAYQPGPAQSGAASSAVPVIQPGPVYQPSAISRKKSNAGLIIAISAAVVVAAVVLVLVIRPFGGGLKGGSAFIDPQTVLTGVGNDYMGLLPEKPGPIVPGTPLPTAAPYNPANNPGPTSAGTYYCEPFSYSLQLPPGWYPDESALYSQNMVSFQKDSNSILSVMYAIGATSDDFVWDNAEFMEEFAGSSGGSGWELTAYDWTTTLSGYDTFYLFFTTYKGSSAHLYNYTFVINDGDSGNCFVFTFSQDSASATEQDLEEALSIIDSFVM